MFTYISDPTPDELTSAIIRNPLTVTPNTTVMEVVAQMSGVRTVDNIRTKGIGVRI
jgi:hypothetical protein